jgi:hypothetical protein
MASHRLRVDAERNQYHTEEVGQHYQQPIPEHGLNLARIGP